MCIGFDYDGVINNLDDFMAEKASELLGREVTAAERTEWAWPELLPFDKESLDKIWHWFRANESALETPFIPGSIEYLKHLQETTSLYVTIITARRHHKDTPNLIRDRLAHEGLDRGRIRVFGTKEKGPLMQKLGIKYFVDDYLKNLAEVAQWGAFPICFNQRWNKCGTRMLRIRSLLELKQLI